MCRQLVAYRLVAEGSYNSPVMQSASTFEDTTPSQLRPVSGWKVYLAVLLSSLLFYSLGAQRGPAWQDSGIFQWRILNFDLFGDLGLALSHPLLILLGKAFSLLPFGPLAWRMNLVSAAAGAVAVANVTLLVRRLSGGRSWAMLAGAAFFLCHTMFWLSTICESQVLLVALFTTELHVLVSLVRRATGRGVFLLGLVNGLGLMAHNLALLALPAYALVVLYLCWSRKLPWWSVVVMILGWVVGAGGFMAMVVYEATDMGLGAAISSAFFGRSWRGSVLGGSSKAVRMGVGYILYSFPNMILPLMGVGLIVMRRRLPRPLMWAFGYLTAVYLLFAIRYPVPDQFMFFLPFYVMVSILGGMGLDWLARVKAARPLILLTILSVVLTPLIYASAPVVWPRANLPVPGRKDLPYRDPVAYWIVPWKARENSAGLFARQALQDVPDGSTIIADSTALYPLLWTKQLEMPEKSIRLLGVGRMTPEAIPIGTPDVFVVSRAHGYYPAWLDEVASLEPIGTDNILYRVAWRTPSTAPSRP